MHFFALKTYTLKRTSTTAFFTLVGLLCLNINAHALTLNDAYQAALQNDPQWLAEKSNHAATKARNGNALSYLLPDISAQATWKKNSSRNDLTPNTAEYDADSQSLMLRQPLFRVDKWQQYKAAKQEQNSLTSQNNSSRHDLLVRTTRYYFNVLSAILQAQSAESALQEAEIKRKASHIKKQLGLITAMDVNLAEAQYAEAQANRSLAQLNAQLQSEYLAQSTHIPIKNISQLSVSHINLQPLLNSLSDLATLKKHLIANNQELANFNAQITKAKHGVRQAQALFIPQVDFVASYSTNDSLQFFNQQTAVIESTNKSYGLEVNWPIFQGGTKFSQARGAIKQHEALLFQRQQTQNALETRLTQNWYQLQQQQFIVHAKEQNLTFSQAKLKQAETGLTLGANSAVELSSATSLYNRALHQLTVAKLDYLQSWLAIKALTNDLDNAASLIDTCLQINTNSRNATTTAAQLIREPKTGIEVLIQ